jgi:hypothetical protein
MPARENLVAGILVGAILLVLVILAIVFSPESPSNTSPSAGRMYPPQTETTDGG